MATYYQKSLANANAKWRPPPMPSFTSSDLEDFSDMHRGHPGLFKPSDSQALTKSQNEFKEKVSNRKPDLEVPKLSDAECCQIQKYWETLPERTTEYLSEVSLRDPFLSNKWYLASDDDKIASILAEQIRSRVFRSFPLRVMKLPLPKSTSTMKLEDRGTVVNHIIKNKLNGKVLLETRELLATIGSLEIDFVVDNLAKFAVLSHTWGPDEPNHEDFLQKRNTDSSGYKKLMEFCRIAHEQHGAEFAWADTVCIDKRSSSELDESIRSMFKWYHESFICIIHLAETDTLHHFTLDKWFTRGWTLQELLAPRQIKFYNRNWCPFTGFSNEKIRRGLYSGLPDEPVLRLLRDGISRVTGISVEQICNFRPGLEDPPLPERLKWIARRATTRPEDISYSMMGILNVSISVAYGEGGERAFFRLFQAALEVNWSPGWFLWTEGCSVGQYIYPSKIIPSSPSCYLKWDPSCTERLWRGLNNPVSLTNSGLLMKVLVVPIKVLFSRSRDRPKFTCSLSKDIIEVRDQPRTPGVQLAFGIFGTHRPFVHCANRIGAVLLANHAEAERNVEQLYGKQGQRNYSATDWQKFPGEGTTFILTLRGHFLNLEMDEWPMVKIPESDFEAPDIPKMEFRNLYL